MADEAEPSADAAADDDGAAREPRRAPGTLRFALVFAALVVVTFPLVVAGVRAFVARDFGYFTYPLADLARELLRRGEWPTWNPYSQDGIPLLAQWNTATLYPPSLLWYVLPLPWSLHVHQLAHLVLAAVGARALAARSVDDEAAADLAGTAFGFGGLALGCLGWTSNLAALAWMPWIVLLASDGARRGGRPLLGAALAAATQLFAGSPEIVVVTWLFAGVITLATVAPEPRAIGRAVARLAGVVLVAALLAAPQILPTFELLRHSERSASTGGADWAIPPAGLAHYLVPLAGFFRSPIGVWFQRGQEWTTSFHVGGATLALAIYGALVARRRELVATAALAVLCLWLSLGPAGGLWTALRAVAPAIGYMRYPVKLVAGTSLALPLLAAAGFASLARRSAASPARARGLALRLGAALAVAVLVVLAWALRGDTSTDDRLELATAALRLPLAFAVLALGARAARLRAVPRGGAACALAVVALTWLDLRTHVPDQNPTAPADVLDAGLPYDGPGAPPRLGEGRAAVSFGAYDAIEATMLPDLAKDYVTHRLAMFANTNVIDRVPTNDGFFSLNLREDRELWGALAHLGPGPAYEHVADHVGARWIDSAEQPIVWKARETALPIVRAGVAPRVAEDGRELAAVLDPSFDPARELVIAASDAARLEVRGPVAEARATLLGFEPNLVAVDVATAAPTLLSVAQSWYPCWRATVDGQPARVLRANHAFQAVEVPTGRHRVELRYDDDALGRGLRLAAVGAALWVAGAALAWWRRGRAARAAGR